jgi:hypothetical protein
MPRIDVKCLANADHLHEVMRPLAMYPQTPPCPTCGGATEQILLPRAVSWAADPVVVFRAPDGTFRFPGDINGPGAQRYASQGYERIEMRSAADVRRFEAQMNTRERSRAERRVEAMQANREAREKISRSDLRNLINSRAFSDRGRAIARAVMARNDAKPRLRARDANFHVEVLSYDRSNREAARDAHGRRRRD